MGEVCEAARRVGKVAPMQRSEMRDGGAVGLRHPGIKVSVPRGFSNVLDKKIDQHLADKKLEVDSAIFQTLQDFVRW
ncbi:MAG: hypothetical protein QOF09_557, partial [Alphaproteobacteria bacterium]|nr:hypothetical protein [Alphaproteobacteria bacterium]